jgi:hypothetical protein
VTIFADEEQTATQYDLLPPLSWLQLLAGASAA